MHVTASFAIRHPDLDQTRLRCDSLRSLPVHTRPGGPNTCHPQHQSTSINSKSRI